MLAARAPSVDRRFFAATIQSLVKLGFDVGEACAARGLPHPLDNDDDRIALAVVTRVFELAYASLNEPALAYKLVDMQSHESSSVLFELVRCCRTPLEALRTVCRFTAIATDATHYAISDDAQHITLVITTPPDVPVTPFQVEMGVWFVMLWLRHLREVQGVPLQASVTLNHAALFDPQLYAQWYGCPIHFGQGVTSVRLSGDRLHQTIAGHDERLLAYLRNHAERYEALTLASGELAQRVAVLFAQRMAFGKPSADDLAALLNMSRRSLQRHLLASGTTWAQVTDQVRQQVACLELRHPQRTLQEVAMLTGYEDTRAFLRAFRRWTGQTPTQFRLSQGST